MTGTLALHATALGALLAPSVRRSRRAVATLGGALFASHVALVSAGLSPRSRRLGPNRTRLDPVSEAAGEIALTFDDGPDPEVTPRVLDLLDAHGARASFFAVGERVLRHPDLTAEIAARGHRVENHTNRHLGLFSMLPPPWLGSEIDRAQEAIAAATGRLPKLFRPPAGFRSPMLEPVLAARGLELVSWTRRGFDTADGRPERVTARLEGPAGIAPGEILLLHDGRAARSADGRAVVLPVLEKLLPALAERGLRGGPVVE